MTDWLADFDALDRVVRADNHDGARRRADLGPEDRVVGTIARRRPRPVVLRRDGRGWTLNGRRLPLAVRCTKRAFLGVHVVTVRARRVFVPGGGLEPHADGRRLARVVYLDNVLRRRGGLLRELADFSWRPDEDYDVGLAVAMTLEGVVAPPWRWSWRANEGGAISR